MQLTSLLDKITKEFPYWTKTKLKNVLLLSFCILQKETTCLYKLKKIVGQVTGNPTTQPSSNYKRLVRVIWDHAFSSLWIDLLMYVFNLLRLKCNYLVLDGSAWKKGSTYYHYLTLAVVYQGVAIPIYWEDLRKKGNSSQKQRKRIIKKALQYFNLEEKILLADREYIGSDWFKFLIDNEIDFVIRLRKKNYKSVVNESPGKSYEELEAKAMRSKKLGKAVGKRIVLNGMTLMFVIVKNPNPKATDQLIYLISSLDEAPACISTRYPIRWQIEMCFKHLKSNGFELEKANVKGKARQKLLMAIVVFSYTLSVCEGLKNYKKVPCKTYADGKSYKAVSVFRYGIDKLLTKCYSFIQFCRYLVREIHDKLPNYRSQKSFFV
ncbi:hypothetical protein AB832_03230 [Flavobacteriaceae bacterium (ex Bugula neritina AB1)]|nr:hypothetical protein AB832_03230 [Flavobacteriaceae bacterium (ex Bugula neritina AB1)]